MAVAGVEESALVTRAGAGFPGAFHLVGADDRATVAGHEVDFESIFRGRSCKGGPAKSRHVRAPVPVTPSPEVALPVGPGAIGTLHDELHGEHDGGFRTGRASR